MGGKQFPIPQLQHACQGYQFNIRYKPLAGLDPLDRVFVQGKPIQLKPAGQFPLGDMHLLTCCRYVPAAEVIFPVRSFVDKHPITLFDI